MAYTVSETNQVIIEKAKKCASKNGWELLWVRKFDNNPSNGYLSFVLYKRAENDFCTHLFNYSGEGNGYFVYGHYDFKTFDEAFDDLLNRK